MRPPPSRPSARILALPAGAAILASALPARGQEIEPRAYSNAPVGVNFLIGGYSFTSGSLSTDPALPVRNAQFETSSGVLGHVRAIDLWGMSAKVDAILPYTWLSGTADFAGRQIERKVAGFGDARFRLSVNLYGAPALTPQEFAAYRQDVIIGASLQVSAPTGQYDPSRVVNLGTNRWSVRPEIGISKALGRLTLELAAGATVYAENTNFLDGHRRSQDPIYGVQSHVIYNFRSGIWASVDVTWFTGGRTTVDGERNIDLQRNWRVGATVSVPLSARYSLRFSGSGGVAAHTGNNYTLVGVALQYRWGGGL